MHVGVPQTLVATHFSNLVGFVVPSELLQARGFHVWEDTKQVGVHVECVCMLACMV
jgi:hypothetical protein